MPASRTSSMTSLSTLRSTNDLGIRSMSTDTYMTMEDKFIRKSAKRLNSGVPNTSQPQRLNSLESRRGDEYHKTVNGTYYFPNGEVFRPRNLPTKRHKPFKSKPKGSKTTDPSPRNRSNDSLAQDPSLTSSPSVVAPSQIARSHSAKNLAQRNSLVKNLRSSRSDINTNLIPASPSIQFYDASPVSPTPRLQSTKLLPKFSSTQSLSDEHFRSSDSTTSSIFNYKLSNSSSNTPGTSIETNEENIKDEEVQIGSIYSGDSEKGNLSTLNETTEEKSNQIDHRSPVLKSLSEDIASSQYSSENESEHFEEAQDRHSIIDNGSLSEATENLHDSELSIWESANSGTSHSIEISSSPDNVVEQKLPVENNASIANNDIIAPSEIDKKEECQKDPSLDDNALERRSSRTLSFNADENDQFDTPTESEIQTSNPMEDIKLINDGIEKSERADEFLPSTDEELLQNKLDYITTEVGGSDSDTFRNSICEPSNASSRHSAPEDNTVYDLENEKITSSEDPSEEIISRNVNGNNILRNEKIPACDTRLQYEDLHNHEGRESSASLETQIVPSFNNYLLKQDADTKNKEAQEQIHRVKESEDSNFETTRDQKMLDNNEEQPEVFCETEKDYQRLLSDTQREVPPRGDIEVMENSKIKKHHRTSSSISSYSSLMRHENVDHSSPSRQMPSHSVPKKDSNMKPMLSLDDKAFESRRQSGTLPLKEVENKTNGQNNDNDETQDLVNSKISDDSRKKTFSSMLLPNDVSSTKVETNPVSKNSSHSLNDIQRKMATVSMKSSESSFTMSKKKSPSITNFKNIWKKITGRKQKFENETADVNIRKINLISNSDTALADTKKKFKRSFSLSNLKSPKRSSIERFRSPTSENLPEAKPLPRLLEEESIQSVVDNSFESSLILPKLPMIETDDHLLDDLLVEFDGKLNDRDEDIHTKTETGHPIETTDKIESSSINEPFLKDDELTSDQIKDQQIKDMPTEEKMENAYGDDSYIDDNIRQIRSEYFWTDIYNSVDDDPIEDSQDTPSNSNLGDDKLNPDKVILSNDELTTLFNTEGSIDRKDLPDHIKYVEQFKEFDSVEVNLTKFEDLMSSKPQPNERRASASILKKSGPLLEEKKVMFSNKVSINETFPADMYKRYNKCVTQYTLTEASEVSKIKSEMNTYKCNEMLVHEDSQNNTHFFY